MKKAKITITERNLMKTLTFTSTCPECKRPFDRSFRNEWGYVFKGKKYCTYSCMRAAERKASLIRREQE